MIALPRLRRVLLLAAAPVLLAVLATDASAQGKGKGNDDRAKSSAKASAPTKVVVVEKPAPRAKVVKPAKVAKPAKVVKVKKRRTHNEAVDITRQVLVSRGYTVSRVERRGDARVIYFYRGNNGRGKGRGPLMSMLVRPSSDLFIAETAPRTSEATGTTSERASKEILQEVTRRLRL